MFQEKASANCLNIVPTSTEDGAFQKKGHSARVLSPEEAEKLAKEQVLVSEFKQLKLEKEAQKNWDLFYKRNSTNFFKDRHWTTREFQELKACREFADQKLTILEAGCGVGNCLFPLLEEDKNIFAYACDFSPRAVEYVKHCDQEPQDTAFIMQKMGRNTCGKQKRTAAPWDAVTAPQDEKNALYSAERCKVFQCDLTKDDLLDNIPADSVDVVTLIFVLSAIHPDKMHLVLRNIYKVLKPGKCVLFRDYGLYDHAMLRFKSGSKLGENFYVRQDGTRSYFFTEEFLSQLFKAEGYEQVVNEYVQRETVNRKEDLRVPRVFLQSKFQKPFRET
ncbi:methyltransferase-like protein 6 isoform X1 [Camarhynchus parvulus]|uniref:methyltransferase-like protein 6 isoform X1 n=1 Tax=Geospiza parvula TaxID=87175 RepID=UPI001237BFC6|nr:methyltransferase-like protein 6 isoform X1 [Camarhynchus parvulus]XP_030799006.1 methyltransferase-like protein 6 isoform X1 [Camarhynchus parvulus]XP_030799007.1 methyltransferase-like protein 6 isoform X1 [Camarhynchus parvulus]